MSRFDYVKYDEKSEDQQRYSKELVEKIELFIDAELVSPRAKALAHTKLEECYMWLGKAIRDDQVQRNIRDGIKTDLQEERKDG